MYDIHLLFKFPLKFRGDEDCSDVVELVKNFVMYSGISSRFFQRKKVLEFHKIHHHTVTLNALYSYFSFSELE